MPFSFNPLWKLLIDKNMTKEDLRKALGLSPSTIAKMGKGGNVSLEVIHKICAHFGCQPGDLFEYLPAVADQDEKQPRYNLEKLPEFMRTGSYQDEKPPKYEFGPPKKSK